MKSFLLVFLLTFGSICFSAQKKISELDPITNAEINTNDLINVVDIDAAASKKISFSELDLRWLTNTFDSATSTTSVTLDNRAYIEFQESTGNGDNYVRLIPPASLSANYTLTLPVDDGDSEECLKTDGSGVLSFDDCASGVAVSSIFGRTGDVVATASDYDADEVDNTPAGDIAATDVQAAIDELDDEKASLSGDEFTGDISLDNESEVRFQEATGNGDNYVGFQGAASISSNVIWVLPDSDGTSGQSLSTDGSGGLYWESNAPPGSIHIYVAETAPTGYLLCDGSAVSRTTYSRLYAIIGDAFGEGDGSTTFNLPDFRGRFLRGWDNSAGNDPDAVSRTAIDGNSGAATGDAIGSYQADAFGAHTHSYFANGTGVKGVNGSSTGTLHSNFSTGTGSAGGNETRPVNVSVNYIIKY